jgi:hypothetical protein
MAIMVLVPRRNPSPHPGGQRLTKLVGIARKTRRLESTTKTAAHSGLMVTTGVPTPRREKIPRPAITREEIRRFNRSSTETTLMNQQNDTLTRLHQMSHLLREKRRGKRLHARIGRMLQTRPTPSKTNQPQ